MDALTRCTSAVVGRAKRRPNSFGTSLSQSGPTQKTGSSSSTFWRQHKMTSSASGAQSACDSTAASWTAAAASFLSNSLQTIGVSHEASKPEEEFAETTARYTFDFDFDMECLKRALDTGRDLDESGYQSVLQRSQHSQYGTGWMMFDSASLASNSSADEWDGYMTIGTEKVKIKEVSDLLATRYAFLSGAKSGDGIPILTFPDSRAHLPFPDYRRLVTYLLQVPPLEDSYHGYIVVIDRRSDKWTTVKTLLIHIANYFPANLQFVYLLKPEGVLQRALEVGYKTILDSCHFRIALCNTVQELHARVHVRSLTLDLGGSLKYNHLEWVQHRMDIERMRASTQVIAQSLEEFSRCLKDTELPNDAETTQHILDTQRSEREAIKEDFHIAVRRGLSLLKSVRQAESKPCADQLSPTRLHNVTSIERMLIQLEETEKSFERFWAQHERRLQRCLELRRFEDDFRKLQANFAGHMLHLEEHREVGESVSRVDNLIKEHVEYMNSAQDDIAIAENLKRRGEELILIQEKELEGSLRPKCQELERMADALRSAIRRRFDVLQMSKQMHEQISIANAWCAKGVELLTKQQPVDVFNREDSQQALIDLEEFLAVGTQLHCVDTSSPFASSSKNVGLTISPLAQSSVNAVASPDLKTLVLMTTTDTRTLLQQVSARISDIKRMCESRRTHLQQWTGRSLSAGRICAKNGSKAKPVGAVSPDGHKIIEFESPRASTSSSDDSASVECQNVNSPTVAAAPVSKGCLKLKSKGSLDSSSSHQCTPTRTPPQQQHQRPPPLARTGPAIDRKLSLPTLTDLPSPRSPSAVSLSSAPHVTPAAPSSPSSTKAAYVVHELVSTEETYVSELQSIIDCYWKAFENNSALQPASSVPSNLRGRQNVIFGNLPDIYHFHSQIFLRDLLQARSSPGGIARCFLERRAHFYLYNVYCQNKPKSEELRQEVGENHPFFQECQRAAGHRLPLGAYLLKPVQRITKYQLLLKELAKYCADQEYKSEIEQAVDCVLELLQQLNASMHQSHISGFPGDLSSLGQLLLQGKFSVWSNRKHSDKSLRLRRTGKVQQRHLFLYTKGIVFCKHRSLQPSPVAQEFYEFKLMLPIQSINVSEFVKGNPLKFELSLDNRQETHVFLPPDQRARNEWLTRIKQLILDNFQTSRSGELVENDDTRMRLERPISWTSQTSSESSRSSRDLSSNPDLMDRLTPPGDTNNNPPSPRSLPDTETLTEYVTGGVSNGEFSDSENNIVTSESARLIM